MRSNRHEGTNDRRPALRGWRPRVLGVAACVAFASVGSSCNLDPVHQSAVAELGPERADDYPVESQYHRPGEPCGLCHSDKGPASSTFVLSGTVFWKPEDYEARVDNAYVRVVDAENRKRCFVTNCNGNFFIRKADFPKITFPLLVSVERTVKPGADDGNSLAFRRMSGHIGREASCATCHIQGLRDYASPGQIRLFDTVREFDEKRDEKKIEVVTCPPPDDFVQVAECPEDRED